MKRLTRPEFRDALAKGLGRAVLHARRYGLGRFENEIPAVLKRPVAYDLQIEQGRGKWLGEVIYAGRAQAKFRPLVLGWMRRDQEYAVARQLIELAGVYAAAGDVEIRVTIYAVFERELLRDNVLGDDEAIAVDGIDGFTRLAKIVGRLSRKRRVIPDYAAQVIYNQAKSVLGEASIKKVIESADPDAVQFRKILVEQLARIRHPKSRPVSWDYLRRRVVAHDTKAYGLARRFGRKASPASLETALSYLLKQTDGRKISALLGVFKTGTLPRYDAIFKAYAVHSDLRLRSRAIGAIAKLSHPEVRRLALEMLRRAGRERAFAFELFAHNYQDSDGELLLNALKSLRSKDDVHRAVLGLRDIADARTPDSLVKILIRAWELSPCSLCRLPLFRKLLTVESAPGWMIREARWDTDEELRVLASDHSKRR